MTDKQIVEISFDREYFLCGDISGSMTELDPKCGGSSKYNYMLEKFKMFIKEAEEFDPHGGPTVLLFGEEVHTYPETTLEKVKSKLENVNFEGFTNTHLVLREAFSLHRELKSEQAKEGKVHKGSVVLVFTDGCPTNKVALEREIIAIANSIDRREEFSIGFLTVGTVSHDLRGYLSSLENGLKDKTKYNIFDVKELESVTFMKATQQVLTD